MVLVLVLVSLVALMCTYFVILFEKTSQKVRHLMSLLFNRVEVFFLFRISVPICAKFHKRA